MTHSLTRRASDVGEAPGKQRRNRVAFPADRGCHSSAPERNPRNSLRATPLRALGHRERAFRNPGPRGSWSATSSRPFLSGSAQVERHIIVEVGPILINGVIAIPDSKPRRTTPAIDRSP